MKPSLSDNVFDEENTIMETRKAHRTISAYIITIATLAMASVFLISASIVISVSGCTGTEGTESEHSLPASSSPEQIAEQSDFIDFDESSGEAYVNNELLVYAKQDTDADEAEQLFLSVGVSSVDGTMSDIGLYRLVFPNVMSYEELKDIISTLSEESMVSSAEFNPIVLSDDSGG